MRGARSCPSCRGIGTNPDCADDWHAPVPLVPEMAMLKESAPGPEFIMDRIETRQGIATELVKAISDLGYLAQHGALAGAAEILRERRRMIEHAGEPCTPEMASMIVQRADGRADPQATGHYREAGAFCAAEIDRRTAGG